MNDDNELLPAADWQTRYRGDNDSEYQIYKHNAESLGWRVLSYQEWLEA